MRASRFCGVVADSRTQSAGFASTSGSSPERTYPELITRWPRANDVIASYNAVGSTGCPSASSALGLRRAGMTECFLEMHDLRHTHATLALAAGIHPKVVQERLGHSSVTMTLDRYSHAVPGMQADAASAIAALHDLTAARA